MRLKLVTGKVQELEDSGVRIYANFGLTAFMSLSSSQVSMCLQMSENLQGLITV